MTEIKLEVRPDIEGQYENYYSKKKHLFFKYCGVCQAKIGSQPLCKACIHNREVIQRLHQRLHAAEKKLKKTLTEMKKKH